MFVQESKVNEGKPNEVITAENCIKIGERMAIGALKYRFRFGCDYSYRLYNALIRDINRKDNPSHIISDGYDLAQEAALFLFEYVGKKLNDELFTDKNGKPISIKLACIKMLTSKLHKIIKPAKKSVCIDDVKNLETSMESMILTEEQDKAVDEKIEQMKLTDKQKEVLLLRIAGLSFSQIAKTLCKCKSALFGHLSCVRKKYIATFSKPTFTHRN